MSLLYGKELRRAQYSHRHYVDVSGYIGSSKIVLPRLVDGTVNYTREGIRRQASLTFVHPQEPHRSFLAALESDLSRWHISAGLGSLHQLGVFYLRDYSVDIVGEYTQYRLYLQDQSALIAERRPTIAKAYTGDVVSVCRSIILDSGREVVFEGSSYLGTTIDFVLEAESDRWATCVELLNGYGWEIFMTKDNRCRIAPLRQRASALAVDLTPLVLSVQLTRTRRECNHIIVVSNADNTIYRGDVYDRDPRSANRWSMGNDIPMTFTVDGLTSVQECIAAGERLAFKLFTRQVSHTFAMLQNPVLDFNDSIKVAENLYTVDQLSYSLTAANPMYLTGRGEVIAL